MHTASILKIFGDDAFGKVTQWCKAGAQVSNYLIEKNHVFFFMGSVCKQQPVQARALNNATLELL
jgi:hypothetical protein